MMEIQELKKSHRQNAKLLAGRYAGIALLLGHVVGVHSTTTWSKGLKVPPAIKVEGDMCGGLNGIYMYSDLWEPQSYVIKGIDKSAPMYKREALLCSDGDAYHGLKCGKDNEAGMDDKDEILSLVSYLYYDPLCDSDTSEKIYSYIDDDDFSKSNADKHNRWLFDQGQAPHADRDYDLDSQWNHDLAQNGRGDSKCSINGFPLAEVCEPSWCGDESAPIEKGPLLGTYAWNIVGELQFQKHLQDKHGCPGEVGKDGIFRPSRSNQTITLSCYNPYAKGSENYNSDPCGNHPTQVTMQTTATTVTTVSTVTTLVKCGPGKYLVGDKCAECGVDQFQDAADHRRTACTDLTVCVKGTQYESEAPTKETDRECTALTVCDKGTQYEIQAPTKDTDRECTPLTVCDKGTQYESEAPTKDTDRICEATTATATTTTTTTTTATTTTAYDPGNVDCEEKQDACTSACESANKRNYVVATPQNKNGKACGGATDCVPGEDACPTTSTTAATTTTNTSTATTSTNTSTAATASTTTQAANKVAGDGGGAEDGAAAANADADDDAAAEAPTSTATATSATTPTVAGDAAESEAEKTSTAAVVGAVVAFVVIAAVVAIALCKRGGGDGADKPAMVITANPAFARHANVPLTANVMYASAENPRLANNGVYEGVGLVADGRLAANVTYEGWSTTGGAGAGGNRYSGPRPANGGGDMVYYDAEPVPGMHDQPEYAEPDTPAKPLGGVTYAMMQSEQARGGAPVYADVAEVQQRNNHYDLGPQKPRNNHYDLGPQTARGSLTPAGLPARDEGTWQEQEDTIKRDNSFV